MHICVERHIAVEKACFVKHVLNEINYNLIVYTFNTLQPTFPHSQITPLQHYIGLLYYILHYIYIQV